jgi:hypothetical protein
MAVTAFGYFAGTSQDGNTLSRLSLVRAIVEEGRFEIDTNQVDDEWHQFRTADRSVFNGHYYSDKAIGASLTGAAAWAPVHLGARAAGIRPSQRFFKVVATFLGVSVVCALLAPLVYAFVVSVAGGRSAIFVTVAVVFGTAIYRYSTAYYGHVQAGVLLFGAFFVWFRARHRGSLSLRDIFASGALLGFMVVVEYPAALLAVVFGGYMLLVLGEQRRLGDWRVYAIGAAGVVLALAPLLYYNLQVYGNPFTTGYQHHATAKFAAAHAHGLSGIGAPDPVVMLAMTVHPLMGIFWQSPVLLVAAAGWWAMRSTAFRAEGWFALVAIVAYLALMSGYYEWSGGLAYTPRHLIPMVPLFAIPLAFVPRRWAPIAWTLASLSILQHQIAVAARWEWVVRLIKATLDEHGHPTTMMVSTIWNVLWPNLRAGLFQRNRGTLLFEPGFVSLIPLFVLEALLLYALHRAMLRREPPADLAQPAA